MATIDYKKKIKDYMNSSEVDTLYKSMLNNLFPELAESEEERIMIWIKNELESKYVVDNIVNNVMADKALAWLEKQGEQKHAEWSEEDEKCLENAIMYCKWARDIAPNLYCYETTEKSINWLKSLKDRVQPQPKQEWSEEDEQTFIKSVEALEDFGKFELADWLKEHKNQFLKPQNTWKPSEEMLEALYKAIPENVMAISEDEMLLDKLYQGLKYGRVLSKN